MKTVKNSVMVENRRRQRQQQERSEKLPEIYFITKLDIREEICGGTATPVPLLFQFFTHVFVYENRKYTYTHAIDTQHSFNDGKLFNRVKLRLAMNFPTFSLAEIESIENRCGSGGTFQNFLLTLLQYTFSLL